MIKLKICLLLILFIYYPALAFQNLDEVEIEAVPITKNVYMLTGAGGNIGVLTGVDGIFMIDDQFSQLSPKIMDKLKSLSNQPVRFLINSHHHGDHTGGNPNFQEKGALIFAHENVRKRLKENGSDGLPVVTFDQTMNLYINGNDIIAAHVHNAHTDGDVLIYLPQSNVLHTGDTFFNGRFPYIDLSSGGSAEGDINAARIGLSMINRNTKIIPGHGKVASYTEYENYLRMLEGIRDNTLKAIAAGKSKEEIINDENITADFYIDEEMKDSFISGPKIRETFYISLKAKARD